MQIWVYSIMRDEMAMLPWWLRHYQSFADRLVIFDDNSSDGSPTYARQAGVEVEHYPAGAFDDAERVEFANGVCLEARGHADWVIWVDSDEFAFHPQIRSRLEQWRGSVTRPRVEGYSMVSSAPLPLAEGTRRQLYELVNTGVRDPLYDKPCVVDPAFDFRWLPGKHALESAIAAGWEHQAEPLKLLHYRFFGRSYWTARNARNYGRLSPRNLSGGYGHLTYPGYRGSHDAEWFERAALEPVVDLEVAHDS